MDAKSGKSTQRVHHLALEPSSVTEPRAPLLAPPTSIEIVHGVTVAPTDKKGLGPDRHGGNDWFEDVLGNGIGPESLSMSSETGASVKQLSQESERTRDAFVQTVGTLKEEVSETVADLRVRLSPSHMKTEFKQYVRSESSDLLSSIERKARENPLQAIAIGAGVAYPFLGFLKSNLVPILLVGSGIWLSKQDSATVRKAVSDGASDIAHTAADLRAAAVADVDSVNGAISETARAIADSATAAAEGALVEVKVEAVGAMEAISTRAAEMTETSKRVVNQSHTALDRLIDRNPLLVGGIALAVGAFVAASIPSSRVENRLFGERSNEVKDKAVGAVSEGVSRAKEAVSHVAEDVAAAAAAEGLSGDGLSRTIESAASAVKAVVDKGIATALAPDNPDAPTAELSH